MIHLEVLKKSSFFSKTPFVFLEKSSDDHFDKSHYFRRFLRQIRYFYRFLKFSLFFKKSIIFLRKKNVLRNRNISVAFYDNFALFSDFEEFMFFWKNSSGFSIKINFWTFWEFLLFLSHSTANLPNLAPFIYFRTIFPKTHLCFEKPQNLKVLRYLTNSIAF